MRLERPPELADGGFWYVVPVEVVPAAPDSLFGDERRPAVPGSVPFTATHLDDDRVVIRTAEPVVGLDSVDESPGRALLAAGQASRPRGRIRGR